MNSRTWLFVGFALMGVFLLAQVAIGLPSSMEALFQSMNVPGRQGRERLQVLILAAPLFKTLVGLFLVVKGPLLARYLAEREERLGELKQDRLHRESDL